MTNITEWQKGEDEFTGIIRMKHKLPRSQLSEMFNETKAYRKEVAQAVLEELGRRCMECKIQEDLLQRSMTRM